jgi:hypothetical protein
MYHYTTYQSYPVEPRSPCPHALYMRSIASRRDVAIGRWSSNPADVLAMTYGKYLGTLPIVEHWAVKVDHLKSDSGLDEYLMVHAVVLIHRSADGVEQYIPYDYFDTCGVRMVDYKSNRVLLKTFTQTIGPLAVPGQLYGSPGMSENYIMFCVSCVRKHLSTPEERKYQGRLLELWLAGPASVGELVASMHMLQVSDESRAMYNMSEASRRLRYL